MPATPLQYMNPTPGNLVQLENVSFGWTNKIIFDGIDISIPQGKITTIMGPSGSGKTTLLKLITGQLYPGSGNVIVDGLSVPKLKRTQLLNLRIRMGMMFQHSALFTDINVFDNVAYPLREHTNLSKSLIRNVVLMKLQAVGLRGAYKLMPSELSGGMLRRVALARAVALDPMILLYDDPFSGQDPVSLGVLMRLIKTLNNALGITSILVSHDVDEVNEWTSQLLNGLPNGPVSFHYPANELARDFSLD